MTKTKIGVLLTGLFLCLTGCEEPKDSGVLWVYKDYLVDAYLSVDKLKITDYGRGSYGISAEGAKILKDSQDPGELAQYKQLAALHGGWIGRKVPFLHGPGRVETICYDEQIERIDVTCDVVWDDKHPAGNILTPP